MAFKPKKTIPLVQHNAPTEKYKRPNHPDFWTSEECKKNQFTGIRQNNVALHWEFWILGECVKEIGFLTVKADSMALTKAHVEIFHMAADPEIFKRP